MIYIGTDEGIYRWIKGTFWPAFHSLQECAVVSLASPGAGLLAVVDDTGRVWESDNNGLNWAEIPVPEGAGRPLAVALADSAFSILLTTKPLGLYRRVVGAPVPRRPSATLGGAPAFFRNVLSSTALLTRPAKRRGEASDAEAWTKLKPPPASGQATASSIRTLAVGPGAGGPWYAAVTGAGLWRSEDGGASWQSCPGVPAEVYAIRTAVKPNEIVAVATADGCWVSKDRGQTWEDRSGGLEQARHLRALELDPDDSNTMLAGAAAPAGTAGAPAGARFSLYESADGGKTWGRVRRGFPEFIEHDTISDIRFDPDATENAIVALESGELWRTNNGGAWWEPIARQIRAARVLCAVG